MTQLARPPWSAGAWGRALPAGLAVALALPVFLSFNYVHRFGVDLPYLDDWELVPLIDRWLGGTVRLEELFAPHNEHRIFWPRLAMLAVVRWGQYDLRALMFASWALLSATTALLLWEHVGTFGRTRGALLLWVPLAWLLLSPRQYENLLWGWQIQFFLCTASFSASMVSLHRAQRAWKLALAAVLGGVCSFTIAAGLGVWPAGAALLMLQRRGWRWVAAWGVAGVAAIAAYLRGFDPNPHHGDPTYLLSRPLAGGRFLLAALGAPFSHDAGGAIAAGAVLIGLGAVVLIAWRRGALDRDRAVLAAPFALFALAFLAMLAVGRGQSGDEAALASRYTSISVFAALAVHRGCLAITWERVRPALGGVLLCLSASCVSAFFVRSYREGFDSKAAATRLAAVLRDHRNRSDEELQRLYPVAAVVRERALILERHRLSVFAPR